jgi:pyridoxine/pyridoxamine 5'-phosphate oxidase
VAGDLDIKSTDKEAGKLMQYGQKTPLLLAGLDPDPIIQFSIWLQKTEQAEVPQANAKIPATSIRQGKPAPGPATLPT